jgi:hypothetical protein
MERCARPTREAGYRKRINPSLTDGDRIDEAAGRLSPTHPVCPPEFLAMIPKRADEDCGLQVADTCFYCAEDRGCFGERTVGQA